MKGSLAATLILFAPPVMLLGMVSPMAIRLLADAGVGRAAGRVFAVSTVGSIFGTYVPTLVLVPVLGSRMTLLVAAGMLLLPAVVGLLAFAGRKGATVAGVAVLGAAIAGARTPMTPQRPAPPEVPGATTALLAERESPYQYLTVQRERRSDSPAVTRLTINEGVYTYHSLEVEGEVLTGRKYYDDYALLPLLLDLRQGEALRVAVVGLACGVTARQFRTFWEGPYRVSVDGAEIDPVVMELGRQYFHLPPPDAPWLRAYAMDGRQMLVAAPPKTRWHAIVVDAFSNELYVPFHLGTREFFQLCRDRLEPGGVFAMNVYAYRPDSPNLAALENTLAVVFGGCRRVKQYWGGNFLLIARKDAPVDLARLLPSRAKARFPAQSGVPEWPRLLEQGQWMPEHATTIAGDERRLVLTDDYAPLESMTDAFIAREEAEVLGR
jgi:spermidine synthase